MNQIAMTKAKIVPMISRPVNPLETEFIINRVGKSGSEVLKATNNEYGLATSQGRMHTNKGKYHSIQLSRVKFQE